MNGVDKMINVRIDSISSVPLNAVSIDGVLNLRGGGRIPCPIDVIQRENGDILFIADFAERYQDLSGDDLDVASFCGVERTNSKVFIQSRGVAFATRIQSRVRASTRRSFPGGIYATIEGAASEVIVRSESASRLRDLESRQCQAKIHNFRPVSSRSNRYPRFSSENFGVRATLAPIDEYGSASLELENRGGNRQTYELTLESMRTGYRGTSSWLTLCDRICMILGLLNLSSVWVSSVQFTKHSTSWEHWVNHLSRPFSMTAKNVCDGIVWREDALNLALSKGNKGQLEKWGYLIHYFLDAYSERRHPEYRALLACTLLDSVISRHSLQSTGGSVLPRNLRRSLAKELRSSLNSWMVAHGLTLSQITIQTIGENIGSITVSRGRSYKDSLSWLVDHYDLPVEVPIDTIASARNALVHTGFFQQGVRGDDRLRRLTYHEITWTAVALLWRLLGFKGTFPQFNTYSVP